MVNHKIFILAVILVAVLVLAIGVARRSFDSENRELPPYLPGDTRHTYVPDAAN